MERFKLSTPQEDITARPEGCQRKPGETDVPALLRRIKQGGAKHEPMSLSYASLSGRRERTFWRLNMDGSPKQDLKEAKILIGANAKAGYGFTMTNGLRCTVKRANLTRRQQLVIDRLKSEHGSDTSFLSWITAKFKNTAYVFTFFKGKRAFGMICDLSTNRPRMGIMRVDAKKLLKMVGDVKQGLLPYAGDRRLEWLFCDNSLFPATNAKARAIIFEAIKSNLPPSITVLLA